MGIIFTHFIIFLRAEYSLCLQLSPKMADSLVPSSSSYFKLFAQFRELSTSAGVNLCYSSLCNGVSARDSSSSALYLIFRSILCYLIF
jgi:hypothetical protein